MTIWRSSNIGTKVLTRAFAAYLTSIVLISSISIIIAQRELEKQAFNKLIATREIKAAAIKNLEQAMLEGFTDKPPAQATMACIQWFLNSSTA